MVEEDFRVPEARKTLKPRSASKDILFRDVHEAGRCFECRLPAARVPV